MKNTIEDIFLTPNEVAKMLKLKRLTIYQWCKAGKIPVYKIGKQYRIPREQLFSWIYRQKQKEGK